MTWRFIKIDWSRHWTRAWPGYLNYLISREMDRMIADIATDLYRPNPFMKWIEHDQ